MLVLVLRLTVMVPSADAARTRVVRINPFNADGDLGRSYRITLRRQGECPQPSFRAVGAYRCFARNGVFEPCFPDPAAPDDEVVCLRSPYDKGALRIFLTESPDTRPSRGRLAPWAMTLTSGRRCVFIGGATDVIGGKRLNYFCTNRAALLGTPRKNSRRRWRIGAARPTRQGYVRGKTVRVRVAYYGARR